jgi:hypothetical protein
MHRLIAILQKPCSAFGDLFDAGWASSVAPAAASSSAPAVSSSRPALRGAFMARRTCLTGW